MPQNSVSSADDDDDDDVDDDDDDVRPLEKSLKRYLIVGVA